MPLDVEIPAGSSQQPHLSEAALSTYREAMAGYDKAFADPETSAALREFCLKQKEHIETACKVTGQSLTQPDPRTVTQQAYDARHAMTPTQPSDYELALTNSLPVGYEPENNQVSELATFLAAMSAPVALGQCIVRELGTEQDAEKIAAALKSLGKDYASELEDARHAIRHAGQFVNKVPFRAEQLGLFSLVQTAIWGRHLQAWQKGRPQ